MENAPPRMPAKRALAALDGPSAADAPARRVSKKVMVAIDAFVGGDCKKTNEAAERAGLARGSLSRALNKPHIAGFMRQKVIRSLALASARAGAVKQELLDCENTWFATVPSFVLALAGIQPTTSPLLNVNIEVKAGYVIDLSDDPRQPGTDIGMRIVSSAVRPALVDLDQDNAE